MKVTVIADKQGKIISVSQFGDVGEKISGIAKAGVVPAAGQTVHEIDLSGELQQMPLLDLHKGFRVDTAAGQPRLVKL
jgi:hypothetical protein